MLADPLLAARAASGSEYLVGTGRWQIWPEVQLVLLPTASPWLAPAWPSFYGAAREDGHPAWAAAMLRWHQRWGAALVASWALCCSSSPNAAHSPASRHGSLPGS